MSQLITQYPLPIFAAVSLFIFLTMMAAILYWLFRLPADAVDQRASIPFHDGSERNHERSLKHFSKVSEVQP